MNQKALALTVLVTALCLALAAGFSVEIAQKGWTRYWMQVISGNWAPGDAPDARPGDAQDGHPAEQDRWVALSAFVAIALNLTTIGATVANFVRLLRVEAKLKERDMRDEQLYDLRDRVIINRLHSLLIDISQELSLDGETRKALEEMIDSGFKQGNDMWSSDHLDALLTPEVAREVRAQLRSRQIKVRQSERHA